MKDKLIEDTAHNLHKSNRRAASDKPRGSAGEWQKSTSATYEQRIIVTFTE
jgi:hypothetical protein